MFDGKKSCMSRRDFLKATGVLATTTIFKSGCDGAFKVIRYNGAPKFERYDSKEDIKKLKFVYLNAANFRGRTTYILETITEDMARFRIKSLANFLVKNDIDIFCGSEFDYKDTCKTGSLNQPQELAKSMGNPYNYVVVDEFIKSPLWTTGNCVISRYPLKAKYRNLFGKHFFSKFFKHLFKDFIHVPAKVGKRNLQVVVNHFFDRWESVRLQQVKQELKYLKWAKKYKDFWVIAGDYNDSYDSKTIKLFEKEGFRLPKNKGIKTFPSSNPKLDLDHILSNEHIKINNFSSFDFPWSDHMGVYCEVEFLK